MLTSPNFRHFVAQVSRRFHARPGAFSSGTLLPQAVAPAAKVYPQDELSPPKKDA
jgi:hypothetical protein